MGALPVKYVRTDNQKVDTCKGSRNTITNWINNKFNSYQPDIKKPTKIKGSQEQAIYNVFNNYNLPIQDLMEKEHVALLYPDTFYHNMRLEVIRDNKIEFYKSFTKHLFEQIEHINPKKAHGEDLFAIGSIKNKGQKNPV